MKIVAGPGDKKATIVGHGLRLADRFELSSGVSLDPTVPALDFDLVAKTAPRFQDYAATITGHELATFCIAIEDERGGEKLVVKAWNALWLFHLLGVATGSPCFSLYAITGGREALYSAANRSIFIRPLDDSPTASPEQLLWAREHKDAFYKLINNHEFSYAMRCYGNAHYLFDNDVRLMLLWAGIEGILSVDAELNRRIALYSALLFEGTPAEKAAHFNEVKKAYAIRNKAVHGGRADKKKLEEGYRAASRILVRILFRCVELGRVPSPVEFDKLAVSQTIR